MTTSGKSFWAERRVSAVLPAGNQLMSSKTRNKATAFGAKGGREMSLERCRDQIGPYKPWLDMCALSQVQWEVLSRNVILW